ncbi:MAG: prefoldin subunit alpha [Nitrososphaerales archaeon]
MSEEEKLQALVGQMNVIEAYLNDIGSKEAAVGRLMEEGRSAIDAIRNVSGNDQAQTLMPIGIGVYMRASVTSGDKLLISIGSGVAVEKSREDAISYVESRVKELEVALRSMFAQKQELEARMEQTRAEVNALAQKLRSKSG